MTIYFSGLSLLEKIKSSDIRQSLNIESLLVCIERSQLRWYGYVSRISYERTSKQLMDALPSGKRPRGAALAGRIMLKIWSAASCRRSGCLEIPAGPAAPATPKGQASKGKCIDLIQCFPRK